MRPTYVPGADNAAELRAQSIKYRDDPSGIIEDTRMPGFNVANDPSTPGLAPCPDTWGNGTQVGRGVKAGGWKSRQGQAAGRKGAGGSRRRGLAPCPDTTGTQVGGRRTAAG